MREKNLMIRLSFRGIEARRFVPEEEPLTTVAINNASSIVSMEMRDGTLVCDFVFTCTYNPSIASIKIDGRVYYSGSDSETILEAWKMKKGANISTIQNAIIQKSLLEAAILAKELDIVSPIPLPIISEEKKIEDSSFYG
jgi:hypothetical protein